MQQRRPNAADSAKLLQEAKSFELQATIHLCRLWQQHGEQADAGHLLAAIYDRFSEGFDKGDLTAAVALLEEWA